jgi:hypothetical protein
MIKLLKCLSLIIVFGFINQLVFCQEKAANRNRVIDKSNQGIPYVNIYLQNRQVGMITDSMGYFSINQTLIDNNINDTIVFSSLGYKIIKESIKDIKEGNNIILSENSITIPELLVYPKKYKFRDYGFLKSRTSLLSLSGNPGDCLFVHIQNKNDFKEGIVESVTFKLKDVKTPDFYKVRLRLFLKQGDDFIVNDVFEKPFVIADFPEKSLTIDLKKFNIPFSKDGVYVGLEWIIETGKPVNMKVNCKPRLKCTRKKDNNSFWVYDMKKDKFIPFPLYVKNEFPDIQGMFRKIALESIPKIGITIAEFEE